MTDAAVVRPGGARTPRLHVPRVPAEGEPLELDRTASHRLGEVLRVREGATVALFDGAGAERLARVVATGRRVRLEVGADTAREVESPLAITLLQGVSRGDRMDATVRQATELGAAAVRPVTTRRVAVRLDEARAAKRLEHWRAVAVSACEQCGRTRLPEVLEPLALADALAAHAPGSDLALQLDPGAPLGLGAALGRAAAVPGRAPASIAVLIGPESGLDPEEIEAARAAGFEPVRFGPRVLRTETAGPAVVAVLQARFGDLDS